MKASTSPGSCPCFRTTTLKPSSMFAKCRFPASGVFKTALKTALHQSGFEYVHLAMLGCPRTSEIGIGKMATGLHIASVSCDTLPQESAIAELAALSSDSNCALLCFEADHNFAIARWWQTQSPILPARKSRISAPRHPLEQRALRRWRLPGRIDKADDEPLILEAMLISHQQASCPWIALIPTTSAGRPHRSPVRSPYDIADKADPPPNRQSCVE